MEEEIKELKEQIAKMKKSYDNKFEGQQLEINKLTKIINHVNMIRVCEILKEQY